MPRGRGVGVFASNLGWHDSPLRDLASARLGLPVAFDHDVRAASWAEASPRRCPRLRRCRRARDRHGHRRRPARGRVVPYTAGGYAGEIGHSSHRGRADLSLRRARCLEAVASAGAIARRYREATGVAPDGGQGRDRPRGCRRRGSPQRSGTRRSTPSRCRSRSSPRVVAPQAVVIGGGLSAAGGALFDELRRRLADRLSFHRIPVLVPAELSGNAGLLGAALRARELT